MGLNDIQGDVVFFDWNEGAWEAFSKKEHELRMSGFRKVNQDFGFQDMYVIYKRKKKRVV